MADSMEVDEEVEEGREEVEEGQEEVPQPPPPAAGVGEGQGGARSGKRSGKRSISRTTNAKIVRGKSVHCAHSTSAVTAFLKATKDYEGDFEVTDLHELGTIEKGGIADMRTEKEEEEDGEEEEEEGEEEEEEEEKRQGRVLGSSRAR